MAYVFGKWDCVLGGRQILVGVASDDIRLVGIIGVKLKGIGFQGHNPEQGTVKIGNIWKGR